jgi:hypothetical protein
MSKIPMFPNKFAIFASILGVIRYCGNADELAPDGDLKGKLKRGIYHVTGNVSSGTWCGLSNYSDFVVLNNQQLDQNPYLSDNNIAIGIDYNTKKLVYFNDRTNLFETI